MMMMLLVMMMIMMLVVMMVIMGQQTEQLWRFLSVDLVRYRACSFSC